MPRSEERRVGKEGTIAGSVDVSMIDGVNENAVSDGGVTSCIDVTMSDEENPAACRSCGPLSRRFPTASWRMTTALQFPPSPYCGNVMSHETSAECGCPAVTLK